MNLSFPIVVVGLILFIKWFWNSTELDDRNVINKEYEKIKNNKKCMNYIHTLNQYPWWRMCVFFGIITTIIISAFIKYNLKQTNSNLFFWNVFWFMLLTIILMQYKFLAHWHWHYVSNNGGAKNNPYT